MRFAGAVAVVTGGGSGIGEAVSRGLAAGGARVAVVDIDAAAAARVAGEIGGTAVPADITEPDSVGRAISLVTGRLGAPAILVNNAGVVAGAGPLAELPVQVFDRVFAVNVRGTFLVTQAVARAMIRAGAGGAIVNISSAGAVQPTAGLGHYEASKAAINALTRSAALELAAHRIRVNAVAPGPVDTPMTSRAMADPAARGAWEARIPLGRIAGTGDVVPVVLMLASADAAHVTGVVIPVDGGQLLT